MYGHRRGLGDGTLVLGTSDPGSLTLGTSNPGSLTLGVSDSSTPVFGAPAPGAPANPLNCTTATCGSLNPDPNAGPAVIPFCGAGSVQWITGLDNCVVMIGGFVGLALLFSMTARGRR